MFRFTTLLLVFSILVGTSSFGGEAPSPEVEFRYAPLEQAVNDLLLAKERQTGDEEGHMTRVEMQRAYVYSFFGDRYGQMIDIRLKKLLSPNQLNPLTMVISR